MTTNSTDTLYEIQCRIVGVRSNIDFYSSQLKRKPKDRLGGATGGPITDWECNAALHSLKNDLVILKLARVGLDKGSNSEIGSIINCEV